MVQVFFHNIEQVYCSSLSSARNRICLAVAWFTNHVLFDELKKACLRKVEVKVLILDDILNRNEFGLDFGELVECGAELRFANSEGGTMHNKFCIIDDSVITGSYNLTYQANKNNENIVVVNEPDVVNGYCEQFEILFNAGVPVKLPYQHIRWTEVKEGDFSELRRNIFRDVVAKNDMNTDLKRTKLEKLNNAYKSGNIEEIKNAGKLPIEQKLRTITEVLTDNPKEFTLKLWEENNLGEPYNNTHGYVRIEKWYYVPYEIKEDKFHREFISGQLKTETCRNNHWYKGLHLDIYDTGFIESIRNVLGSQTLSIQTRKSIPDSLLCISFAKIFFYQFSSLMYNRTQQRTWQNGLPRTISAINLLGIAKEIDGDKVVFYEGWNPQKRGEKIAKEFFTTSPIDQVQRTIADVLTNTQKRYEGELFYETDWDSDEEPADVRFSTIDKWIFIPNPCEFSENRNHEKYIRGYLHFYKWYKRRQMTYMKIKIDIYDKSFISGIEYFLQGSMDISKIPEDLLCINRAKLSIIKLPTPLKVKSPNAVAVFCLAKEYNENNITYYEGWDPQSRGQEAIRIIRQRESIL